MALVKHRNSRRYHAPSETSKIRLGPAYVRYGVQEAKSLSILSMSPIPSKADWSAGFISQQVDR